jgi:hypothetical protein
MTLKIRIVPIKHAGNPIPQFIKNLNWKYLETHIMAQKFFQGVFSTFLLLGLVLSPGSPGAAAPVAATHEEKATSSSAPLIPTVIRPTKSDISPALRTIPPAQMESANANALPLLQLPKVDLTTSTGGRDASSVQTKMGTEAMPAPLLNFDGVTNLDSVYPPDTEGDIGLNHYVQWVNLHFAIWHIDKVNNIATLVYGPAAGNTLWAGFSTPCSTSNDGDPIALYDPLADRWLMSQFALPNYPSAPFYQCIAISVTGDPTGAYYRYQYTWPNDKMNDYPKFGVWPDAYYMKIGRAHV